jgi:hypothetical protein
MPVDMLARGVARIALGPRKQKVIYYARDLRRRNTRADIAVPLSPVSNIPLGTAQSSVYPFELLDDNTPFGWTPGDQ